jgi:LuxR family transcriptional regulator of spore coat protein
MHTTYYGGYLRAMTTIINKINANELACMQWAAAGKTTWEISKILGRSEGTVNYHIQRACLKLGVTRRRAAVAKLLNGGMPLPYDKRP